MMLSFARKSLERLRNSNADNLQSANLGARWLGDLGVLYPIYLCPVGTVLAVSLKIVTAVVCCVRLCTENG
mgnify:CR=1 FL=1